MFGFIARRIPVIVAVALIASAVGWLGVPEVVAPAIQPMSVVAGDRSNYVPGAPSAFYMIDVENTDGEFDEDGNPVTDLGWVLTALYDEHGAVGAVNDGREALYAPIGSVVDYGAGTATVTVEGLMFCTDNAHYTCTGSEFMTDWYLGY
jgi:hypothetical protein